MILCDPYAVNTVATSALKAMQQSVSNEVVPRVRFERHFPSNYCRNFSLPIPTRKSLSALFTLLLEQRGADIVAADVVARAERVGHD